MENILFQSVGIPSKRKSILVGGGTVLILAGLLLVAISNMLYNQDGALIIGVLGIVMGILFICLIFIENPAKYRFFIYTDHIEGKPSLEEDVSIPFSHIYSVQKIDTMGQEMLVLKTDTKVYSFAFHDVATAYKLIEQKLNEMENN